MYVVIEVFYLVRSPLSKFDLICKYALQVAAKKLTLKNVTDYIVDVICKRAEDNYNYGVILIPEGLIDFIPEVPITLLNNIHFLWTCNYALLVLSLYKQYENIFIYSFVRAIVILAGPATYCGTQ